MVQAPCHLDFDTPAEQNCYGSSTTRASETPLTPLY